MATVNPLAELAGAYILRCFRGPELEKLVGAAKIRTFESRQHTWLEGNPIPGACFIVSGLIRAYIDDHPGRQATYTLLWPRETVPTTILQGQEWKSHGVAVSPVVLAIIPSEDLHAACLRTPQRARQVLDDLVAYSFRHYSWERDQRLLPLKRRLLTLFRRISGRVGTPTPEGFLLDFPLNHQTVADLSWVKRDHAGRGLSELVEEGYLIPRPRFRWLVPDRDRLQRAIHSPSP